MELDHEFTVPVPVDQAWSVLLDVERVALCMPGATLDSIAGEEYAGRLKVKLGAMTITYRGTARITQADEATRTITIEGAGKEARGPGTASATIQAQLHPEVDTTRVTVHTKLNVTGRPAQFGRNILAEVGAKLIARFAKALSEELQESPPTPRPAGEAHGVTVTPTPQSVTEPNGRTPQEPPAPDNQPHRGTVAPTPESAAEPGEGAGEQGQRADVTEAIVDTGAGPAPEAATEENGPQEGKGTAEIVDRQAAAVRESEGVVKPDTGDVADRQGAVPALQETEESSGRPIGAHRRQRREDDAIDILEVAGPSVAKRAAPALGAVAALLAMRYLFRRRRGRHRR